MDVLRCTPTRSVQFGPPGVKKSNLRVLRSSVRFSTASLKLPNLSITHLERDVFLPRGNPSSLLTTPLTPSTKTLKNRFITKASSKSSPSSQTLNLKPKWWWRTLAAIPYLYPLHNVWQYADAVYQLHPVLQNYEFLTYRFLDTVALLPSWVVMATFMGTYFLVVRRKEWPHFLRFHVAMALLIDTGLQVFGAAVNWLPRVAFKGNLMVGFWMTLAFLQAYTVLECMRCALAGSYASVPFVSDTARVHADPKMMS